MFGGDPGDENEDVGKEEDHDDGDILAAAMPMRCSMGMALDL